MKDKVIRVAAVPQSLKILLKGQLKFLSQFYEVIGIASPGIQLKETETQEGIKTRPIEIKRHISPISDIKSLWQLYKTFKEEKPLIVHSITPKAGLLSMLAAKIAGVPIRVHTFTGLIFPSKKGVFREILRCMDWLTCQCANRIYPEGEGVKQDLIKANVTKKSLRIIANGNVNGIDTDYYTPNIFPESEKTHLRNELNIKDDDFVFIFVGRLVRDKGVNELIQAFSRIKKENKSAKLLLLGRFEEELDPLEDITRHEIENNPRIVYAGYQNDVRPYFAIADALVFPSYREGFPNVVMQAGAMGLPSIVTDINGCNEIVMEGKNGTIIPPKNTEAMQTAMERMLQDTVWRNELASNARKMIVDRYQQHIVWEALLKEYQALINNPPKSFSK